MVDDTQVAQAVDALRALYEEHGDGYCFPSDKIWTKLVGEPLPSAQRPHIVRRLASRGYIVTTGRTTTAVSDARKGAPTTEYTFGSEISPESIAVAWEGSGNTWSYLLPPPF